MNELINKDIRKGELLYLDGIQNLQKKHMELLTDLIQRPILGKDITDVTLQKQNLLNSDLINTDLDILYKKTFKQSKEKTD